MTSPTEAAVRVVHQQNRLVVNPQIACQRALHHVAHLVALLHLPIFSNVIQATWKVQVKAACLQVALAIVSHQALYPVVSLQALHQKVIIHIVHRAVLHHHHLQTLVVQLAAIVQV